MAQAPRDQGEAERAEAFFRHLDATHERVMDRPRWYLPFLAVAPGCQGQGAGTVLTRHMLDRVAHTGVPCYPETLHDANLRF